MDVKICFFTLLSLLIGIQSKSQSWKALNGPIGAPTTSSIITYEKGEIFTLIASGKVFRSLDKAKTWENISKGLQQIANKGSYGAKIKESPTGEIFLLSGDYLFKFFPATKSWAIFSQDIEIEDFTFSPDGTKIYAGTNNFLYISINGSKFNQVASWWTHSVEFLCLGNNNNFVRRTLGASGDIWKFNDDGSNLRMVTNSRCCRTLFFHKNSNTIFDIDYYVRISKDFGETWSDLSVPNNLNFNKMIELEDGRILGISDKAYTSTDAGLSWNEDSDFNIDGFSYLYYSGQLSKSKKDELVICDLNNSIYVVENTNRTAFEIPVLEPLISEVKQFGEKNIFCNTSSKIQISIDDGLNWKVLNYNYYNNLTFWKDGTVAFYNSDSIYISSDQFKTLNAKTLPVVIYLTNGLMLNNNENIILLDYDKSYISYDKGDSWVLIGDNLQVPQEVESFKMSKQNIIYGRGYDDAIYYSKDYGISWNQIKTGHGFNYDYLYLSMNNVFFWAEEDQSTFQNVYKYSTDFGITSSEFILQSDEYILLVDDYDNVFTTNYQNQNSLQVTNLLTQQVSNVSLNGLNLLSNQSFNLFRGDNGYLYATKDNAPLYKYSEKLNTERGIISGQVFIDDNQDCSKSATENSSRNFQLEASSISADYNLPVQNDGKFKVFVGPGKYELKLKGNSLIWNQCNFPSSIDVQVNAEKIYSELLVKPTEYCADLTTNLILNRLRRCFDNNLAYLTIRNDGSVSAKNSIVKILMDDYFENIQSTVSPESVVGNLWTFNIAEIRPGQTIRINFTLKISCTATINQLHCVKYFTENNQQCKNILLAFDTLQACEKNIGSFDPNDKTALVNGKPVEAINTSDTILEYLIRFQNTGTDTAFNVRLTDKLDINLDWKSLKALAASHDYTYSISEQGLLEVLFKDIMLADSNLSEVNSHGYFKFSIKPKSNLKIGTLVQNTADIYFDFNEAVKTNISKLVLVQLTKIRDFDKNKILELYAIPNPANQVTEIYLPDSWDNSFIRARLLTNEGKVVQTFDHFNSKIVIEKRQLNSGMYLLYLSNEKGNRAFSKIVFK
ncbi:MAG: T9SS type A sorting domain-containing protein [Saprospiraceae bacterium]